MASIFDVIGPVMIGPSSSHTAGAARLAHMARCIFRGMPNAVRITLYGSFAKTYRGHGTDKALLAGLLGFHEDDERLRIADELAHRDNMKYEFIESEEDAGHPNVAKFDMTNNAGRHMVVTGRSLGGGRIMVTDIDGVDTAITGDEYTLVIPHRDRPGAVYKITKIIGEHDINISGMRVFRKTKNQDAVMVIETDTEVPIDLVDDIKNLNCVSDVMTFPKL